MLTYSADEVLSLGMALERRASRFYAAAAGARACDDACRSLLAHLSELESVHEDRLRRWRERLPAPWRESAFARPDEAPISLAAFATNPLLPFAVDPDTALRGDETAEQILEAAIGFEENAIVLYTALREVVPPAVGRDKVEKLIAEEQGHRSQLQELLVVRRVRDRAAVASAGLA